MGTSAKQANMAASEQATDNNETTVVVMFALRQNINKRGCMEKNAAHN